MQEDIKKIAKGLDYLCKTISERGVTNVYIMHSQTDECVDWRSFNPYENRADAFMVLEKMITDCGLPKACFLLQKTIMNSSVLNQNPLNLKHAICTAYLSLIGDKE